MRRRCASGTTWRSSRRCGRCWRRAHRARRKADEELDHAIRQIVSRAVASDEVIDIFAAAGLQEAGHFDSVRRVPGRGAGACRSGTWRWSCCASCCKGEIKTRSKNVVQARSFAEMLEQAIRKYQNRAIETAQVIEELIALAKDMREGRASAARSSA